MEMSRLMAQFTAPTTDAALPLTPIGKISLMTTYTTEKTAGEELNRVTSGPGALRIFLRELVFI